MVELGGFARAKRKRWLGCSVFALTMGMGAGAWADCLPANPTPSSTVTCTGTTNVSGIPFTFPIRSAVTGGALVTNSGTINLFAAEAITDAVKVVNTGNILDTLLSGYGGVSAQVVENSGVIKTSGTAVALGYSISGANDTPRSLVNSGLLQSQHGSAIGIYGPSSVGATIVNTATGEITGLSGAISTGGAGDSTILNYGKIVGGISLVSGDDRIENYGSITGVVRLCGGNDTFIQGAGGTTTGVVTGDAGLDTLIVDSTGGGTVSTAQFLNFETFKQIGSGSLNYVGAFGAGPIALDGNSAVVRAIIYF